MESVFIAIIVGGVIGLVWMLVVKINKPKDITEVREARDKLKQRLEELDSNSNDYKEAKDALKQCNDWLDKNDVG